MTNHLFIGLGGQGCRTLAELKKVMAQRHRDTQKLREAQVGFEFLAIDSSTDIKNDRKCWTYFGEDLSLRTEDWIELTAIRSDEVDRLAIQADVSPWLGNRQQMADFVDGHQGIEGANQRRRFGRLLFAHNADRIRGAIFNQKVDQLTRVGVNQCAFHVFASIAGGTGSGCLVDLVSTLRAQYPHGGLDEHPIFVYVYTTHNDGGGAVVGYFYQNQFASLRDLNALMCDGGMSPLALNLLGTDVRGQTYAGTTPIAQLVLSTSLNAKNIGVPLDTQIRIVAESCFERIFALKTGQMNAAVQQAITGQDIIGNFPWEPLRNPERSYRFSGLGMRRWEVPHRKVHELLATSLMVSSLRQMLFSNWTNNKGYGDAEATMDGQVVTGLLARMDTVIGNHLNSSNRISDISQKLNGEISNLAANQLNEKKGKANLDELDRAAREYYEQSFQRNGMTSYFQVLQRNQGAQIDETIEQLDQMLTEFWRDAANPVALVHIPGLIAALSATLRAKLAEHVDFKKNRGRLERILEARKGEWAKITPLSALVAKRKKLFLAQARDIGGLLSLDIQDRSAQSDASLIGGILNRLQQTKADYGDAQSALKKILKDTEDEIRDTSNDLQVMHGAEGANKYEFDADALATFLQTMERHEMHQQETALALRIGVSEQLNQRPLTSISRQKPAFIERLEEAMRVTTIARARTIHQDLEQRREAPRILEPSLLTVLEHRFGGDERKMVVEIAQFVERAVSSLHIQGGDSPAVILNQPGVPSNMPRKAVLLGLPDDNPVYASRVEAAFRAAKKAGDDIRYDTYRHDDHTQLRLLCVDYWLAARFTTVANKLSDAYRGSNGATIYFCNLDPSGEGNKRPSLFLPTPTELRDRYEAELWLASQPPLDVVRIDQHGVSLIDHGRQDENEVSLLGSSLRDVLETANHDPMFRLHAVLAETLQKRADGRSVVVGLIQGETERRRTDGGQTSPEYRRWMVLREQLQPLVPI